MEKFKNAINTSLSKVKAFISSKRDLVAKKLIKKPKKASKPMKKVEEPLNIPKETIIPSKVPPIPKKTPIKPTKWVLFKQKWTMFWFNVRGWFFTKYTALKPRIQPIIKQQSTFVLQFLFVTVIYGALINYVIHYFFKWEFSVWSVIAFGIVFYFLKYEMKSILMNFMRPKQETNVVVKKE